MRYLKSVLFIALVSVFAVQANASVLLPTSISLNEVVPEHIIELVSEGRSIIELVSEGRNLQITNIVDENVFVSLKNSVNDIVYQDILTANTTVTLSALSSGSYELKATTNLGDMMLFMIEIE
ncbi:MAG: hypothetical protein AB8G11_08045 [Saprospiraceae bacterium]